MPFKDRPEDFDAEDPEAAELDALRGRHEVNELGGPAQLVALLSSADPQVLCDCAAALRNLALDASIADSLLPFGALPQLMGLLEHDDDAVKAEMAGVLMNVCATSESGRAELSVTQLLPALLKVIASSVATSDNPDEPEVRKNSLGALNNLMLDEDAAKSLRPEGGIEILTNVLREEQNSEARLEDAEHALLRALQVDVRAGQAFVDCDGLPVLVAIVASPNEELQARVCTFIYEVIDQVRDLPRPPSIPPHP